MLSYVTNAAKKLVRREEGATLVEYGLLVSLIGVACIIAITALSTQIQTLFSGIAL